MRKFYMLFAVLLGVGIAGCGGETDLVERRGTEHPLDDSDPCACDVPWSLVCGSDGKTWFSECEALCAGVEVVAQGECRPPGEEPEEPEEPRERPDECPELTYWEPVCGVDGKTYPNREKALCEGVEIEREGPCVSVCTDEWDPVCGADGETWSNECYANHEGGVEVLYRGECDHRICPLNWSPVCGIDGRTYGNVCFAGGPENVAHIGACNCDCPDVYEPVCVGETYPNACVAECSQFSEWDEGECEEYR